MTRFLFAAAVAIAVCSSAPPADASNCAVDEYDHNGSTMELQVCDGGNLSISYTRPRSGLRPHGVTEGTLLFDGFEQQDGAISGEARVFSSRCGAMTYSVSGSKNSAGTIVLRGSAPVRNNRCDVTRYRSDRLVFTLLGGATATPPTAVAPSCPAGYVFSGNRCVLSGGPTPTPAGDWYAIAGSFKSQSQARTRQEALGFGWTVMNTRQCPNFTNGYWIAAAGPFGKQEAQAYSGGASHFSAYVKTCH